MLARVRDVVGETVEQLMWQIGCKVFSSNDIATDFVAASLGKIDNTVLHDFATSVNVSCLRNIKF